MQFWKNFLYRLINIIRIILNEIKMLFFKDINEYSKKNLINLKKKMTFLFLTLTQNFYTKIEDFFCSFLSS